MESQQTLFQTRSLLIILTVPLLGSLLTFFPVGHSEQLVFLGVFLLIYPFFWFYKAISELSKVNEKAPSDVHYIIFISFLILGTFVVSIAAAYLIDSIGADMANNLVYFFFALMALWLILIIFLFSFAAKKIIPKFSSLLSIILLITPLFPFGMMYVQYYFNKIGSGEIIIEQKKSAPVQETNELENVVKKYVEDYKSTYSKEQIEKVLIETYKDEKIVKEYVNKYF